MLQITLVVFLDDKFKTKFFTYSTDEDYHALMHTLISRGWSYIKEITVSEHEAQQLMSA